MCDNIIYEKIELLIRSDDPNNQSVNRLEFNRCKYIVTANHIIIEETLINGSEIGNIFKISEIKSYRKIK